MGRTLWILTQYLGSNTHAILEGILTPPYAQMPRSIQDLPFQICTLSVGCYTRVPPRDWATYDNFVTLCSRGCNSELRVHVVEAPPNAVTPEARVSTYEFGYLN